MPALTYLLALFVIIFVAVATLLILLLRVVAVLLA